MGWSEQENMLHHYQSIVPVWQIKYLFMCRAWHTNLDPTLQSWWSCSHGNNHVAGMHTSLSRFKPALGCKLHQKQALQSKLCSWNHAGIVSKKVCSRQHSFTFAFYRLNHLLSLTSSSSFNASWSAQKSPDKTASPSNPPYLILDPTIVRVNYR